jgi:hypothetical protein
MDQNETVSVYGCGREGQTYDGNGIVGVPKAGARSVGSHQENTATDHQHEYSRQT